MGTVENNEINPKIGEYWYVGGFYQDDVFLGKILVVSNKGVVVDFFWGRKEISFYRLIAKWTPSRFLKMLGYK